MPTHATPLYASALVNAAQTSAAARPAAPGSKLVSVLMLSLGLSGAAVAVEKGNVQQDAPVVTSSAVSAAPVAEDEDDDDFFKSMDAERAKADLAIATINAIANGTYKPDTAAAEANANEHERQSRQLAELQNLKERSARARVQRAMFARANETMRGRIYPTRRGQGRRRGEDGSLK